MRVVWDKGEVGGGALRDWEDRREGTLQFIKKTDSETGVLRET